MSNAAEPPPPKSGSPWRYATVAAVAIAATVASGVVHGYLDGRWSVASSDIQAIADRLPALPEQVGPWVKVADQPLDSNAQRMLRCEGYLNREYWNPDTGDRIGVAVLMGPRGPIAVHTPEVCYSSAGTKPLSDRVGRSIETGGQDHRLWNVQFGDPELSTPLLDVWYGWSDGGPWQASKHPRFWLTDRLYKIQLAGRPAAAGETPPCEAFLAHFLPVLQEAIELP